MWSMSSNLKMEAECFSKAFVSLRHNTQRRMSKDPSLNTVPRENLRFYFLQHCSVTLFSVHIHILHVDPLLGNDREISDGTRAIAE
jgi:hypothetical protein